MLVSLMAEKAEIRYDPAYIMPSQIANKVTALGYSSSVLEGESDGRSTVEVQVDRLFRSFVLNQSLFTIFCVATSVVRVYTVFLMTLRPEARVLDITKERMDLY